MSTNQLKGAKVRRLIYEIIKYFTETLNYPFDVSSYHIYNNMENELNINFANNIISRVIAKKNKNISKNRLCIVITINDSKIKQLRKRILFLKQIIEKIKETFWESNVIKVLDEYEKEVKIKIISNENQKIVLVYILIFNLPNNSSIEFIVTTTKLAKLLHIANKVVEIEKDYRKFKVDTYKFEREKRRLDSNLEDT